MHCRFSNGGELVAVSARQEMIYPDKVKVSLEITKRGSIVKLSGQS
jgi:hypothetical protein